MKEPDCFLCQPDHPELIVFKGRHWTAIHRIASGGDYALGWLIVGANRHINLLSDLEKESFEELGVILAQLEKALVSTLTGVSKVYFGMWSETVKHLHFQVIPRYDQFFIKLGLDSDSKRGKRGIDYLSAVKDIEDLTDENKAKRIAEQIRDFLK